MPELDVTYFSRNAINIEEGTNNTDEDTSSRTYQDSLPLRPPHLETDGHVFS